MNHNIVVEQSMGGATDIIMIMLVLAGAYILIKSGKLGELMQGGLKLPELPGIRAPAAAPPTEGGGGGGEEEAPEAPAAPSSGGAAPTGSSCPAGKACVTSNGGSRNECDGVTDAEYEATWCGDFSGDDLSVKTFGPNHSGSSCCWCILSVSPDGAMGIRHEGPHPDTSSKTGTGPAIGKPSCIKAVVRRGSGGINLEGWGLVGGQWKKGFSYTGACGAGKKSTTPAPQQQVAFRCDGSLKTTCATVSPIGGRGGAGGAPAAPAAAKPEPEEEEAAGGAVRAYRKMRTSRGSGCGPKCDPTRRNRNHNRSFEALIAARSRYDIFDSLLARL